MSLTQKIIGLVLVLLGGGYVGAQVFDVPTVLGSEAQTICIDVYQRSVDAYAELFHYPSTVETKTGATIPNPQSQFEFMEEYVLNKIEYNSLRYEMKVGIAAEKKRIEEAAVDKPTLR